MPILQKGSTRPIARLSFGVPGRLLEASQYTRRLKHLLRNPRWLPRKLPIAIARCGGAAWDLPGPREPACHLGTAFTSFLTVVPRSGAGCIR
jgi:hypothetical protein